MPETIHPEGYNPEMPFRIENLKTYESDAELYSILTVVQKALEHTRLQMKDVVIAICAENDCYFAGFSYQAATHVAATLYRIANASSPVEHLQLYIQAELELDKMYGRFAFFHAVHGFSECFKGRLDDDMELLLQYSKIGSAFERWLMTRDYPQLKMEALRSNLA